MDKKILTIEIIILSICAYILPSINASVNKDINFNGSKNYDFIYGEFIIKFTKDASISDSSIRIINEKY